MAKKPTKAKEAVTYSLMLVPNDGGKILNLTKLSGNIYIHVVK